MPTKMSTDGLGATSIVQRPIITTVSTLMSPVHWNATMHYHTSIIEIIFFAQGGALIESDNASYVAEAGDIVIHQPNVRHRESFLPKEGNIDSYTIGISDCKLRGFEEGRILPDGVPPVLSTGVWQSEIEACFRAVCWEVLEQKSAFNQLADNYLQALLLLILRMISEGADRPRHKQAQTAQASLSQRVIKYIEHNYQKEIKMKELADSLHVSHSHMTHVFKREVGASPMDYLTNHRILEAKHMLMMTSMPVREIAAQVGFTSAAHFSSQFKCLTSRTPKEYRTSKLYSQEDRHTDKA